MSNNTFQKKIVIQGDAPGADTVYGEDQYVIDAIRIFPMRFGLFDNNKEDQLQIIKQKGIATSGLTRLNGYPDPFSMQAKAQKKVVSESLAKANIYTTPAVSISVDNPHKPIEQADMPLEKGVQNPQLCNYKYYPTPLNEGFVYVTSKIDKGVYVFRTIWNAGLTFMNFFSDEVPETLTKRSDHFFYANISDELRFFFSPIEFPRETVLKELYEKTHPQQSIVICKDWLTGGSGASDINQGLLEDKDAWFVLQKGNEENANKCKEFVYDQMLKRTLQNNTINHPDATRDVFLMLNDPFGVLAQINEDLTNDHLEHECLLRSIRTGIDPKKIKPILLNNTTGNYITDKVITDKVELEEEHKANLNQIFLIHTLGIGLYRSIFDANHQFPKANYAENDIDEERLKKILAVEERNKMHKIIEGRRHALAFLLESDLFQEFCKNNANLHVPIAEKERKVYWDNLTDLRGMLGTFYENLVQRPYDKDNGLNLSTQYGDGTSYADNDPARSVISALVKKENEAGKLINIQINLVEFVYRNFGEKVNNSDPKEQDANVNPSLAAKYIIASSQILTAIAKLGYSPIELEFYKTINTELGGKTFPISKKEIDERLKKLSKASFGTEYELVDHSWHKKTEIKSTKQPEIETVKRTVSVRKKNPNKLEQIAQVIAKNPMFSLLVDILVIKSATQITGNDSIRNTLDSAAFVVVVQNTCAKYHSALTNKPTPPASVGLRGLRLTWATAGAYIGVTIDIYDARSAWIKSDFDAMTCSIISAASGLGGIGIAAYFANAAWAGWAGLALAAISIGSKYLYAYCKDTPFESFVKLTVFYDWYKFPLKNSPYKNINIIAKEASRKESLKAGTDDDLFYLDNKHLLQEFIYLHSNLFAFDISMRFNKGRYPKLNDLGKCTEIEEVITAIHMNISTDLSLLTADIVKIEMESYFVHDNMDLWIPHKKDKPVPLFWDENNTRFIPKSNTYDYDLSIMHQKQTDYINERDRQKQWIISEGVNISSYKNHKYNFSYYKQEESIRSDDLDNYYRHNDPYDGERNIPAIQSPNSYLVLMIRLITAEGDVIPYDKGKKTRWICNKYASTLKEREFEAQLQLVSSEFYNKEDYWKDKF
jgi:hypothetical protein